MYKLKEPSRKDFEPFFNDAKNTILGRIKDWLDGKVVNVKLAGQRLSAADGGRV